MSSWWKRHGRPVRAGAVVTVLMTLAASGPAAASANPLDGTGPSSAGMPGGVFVRQLLSWGQWLALAACAGAILYGAATWTGFAGSSAGRAANGKTYVIGGAVGVAVVGLLPVLVGMLYASGRGG